MWHLNDDGAIPPLPGRLSQRQGKQESSSVGLTPGCWAVLLDPVFADDFESTLSPDGRLQSWTFVYQGTLRADQEGRVSGDLYIDRQDWSNLPQPFPKLPKTSRIPIYPRRDYAVYFTFRSLDLAKGKAEIATFRYDHATATWGPEEVLTAKRMKPDHPWYPKPQELLPEWQAAAANGDYQCWLIRNDRATHIGKLQMGRITEHLREARIKIARAKNVKAPRDNGAGLTIEAVFKDIGWNVEVPEPIEVEGPQDIWSKSDIHARMRKLRSASDLDSAWVYHVLVVPRWRQEMGRIRGFGFLYDAGALDTEMIPREGVVVAAAATFLNDPLLYDDAAGKRLDEVPRAALHGLMHELGHAMGLLHRFRGRTFMQGTIYAAEQNPDEIFPDILALKYHADDVIRLLHFPDIWIRPGGAPSQQAYTALPVPEADAITDVSDQFALAVVPLRRSVPLGAPVKLQLRLTNISGRTLPGPALLSLADGSVAGRVIRPGQQPQIFSGVSPLDYMRTEDLAPGESLYHGETLLRGPQGALFPEPGRYGIEVQAGWVGPGGIARVAAHCEVLVTPPRNRRHERVALDLLAAQELSILLIFRPVPDTEDSELRRALEVLKRALKTPELRDSFGPFEARRRASVDIKKAARLIDEDSLMTTSEIEDLLAAALKAGRAIRHLPRVRRMLEICHAKAQRAVCKNLAPDSLFEYAEELLRCL